MVEKKSLKNTENDAGFTRIFNVEKDCSKPIDLCLGERTDRHETDFPTHAKVSLLTYITACILQQC